MKEYHTILLEDKEVQFLEEITLLTKESIKFFPFPDDVDTALKSFDLAKFTFWYKNNHIVGLYFSHSDLQKIPESIGNLSKLRFLFIGSSYFINSFPSTFKNLQCLEVLILDNTLDEAPIVNIEFPDVFKDLKNLKKIMIEGQFNILFPPSFVELESLEELYLDSCFISTTQTNFLLNFNVKNQYHIAHPVYDLPDNFGKLKSLKKLTLYSLGMAFSGIENLPESLGKLTSLTELNLSECDTIQNIEIIFDITSLENLNLSYCKIKFLSKNISKLKNLKELNLSYNKLQELPSEIKKCHQLEKINLYSNLFKKELECLNELPSLKSLIWNKHYPEIIPKNLFNKRDLNIELF